MTAFTELQRKQLRFEIRCQARQHGLLLDKDEIVFIRDNVKYILNENYDIISEQKASEFEKRLYNAASSLHGRRKGEMQLGISQRDPMFEKMVRYYHENLPEKAKNLMTPYIESIISGMAEWRKVNWDVSPTRHEEING